MGARVPVKGDTGVEGLRKILTTAAIKIRAPFLRSHDAYRASISGSVLQLPTSKRVCRALWACISVYKVDTGEEGNNMDHETRQAGIP